MQHNSNCKRMTQRDTHINSPSTRTRVIKINSNIKIKRTSLINIISKSNTMIATMLNCNCTIIVYMKIMIESSR